MSLQSLTGVLQQQAKDAAGKITINEATLKLATLTCAGLNDLLTAAYVLPPGTYLETDTTGFTIPNPQGDTLTVQGRVSVLSLVPANTLATLVFRSGDNDTVSLVIRIDLSNWTFETSFPYMNGYPFKNITYDLPTLVFSTEQEDSWQWQPFQGNGQPQTVIALAQGQNYASWIQMNEALKPYLGFVSGLLPGTNLPLSGPFDLSNYKPDDQTDPVIYPDLALNAPITGIQPFSLSVFRVATPSVGINVIEEPDAPTPEDSGDDPLTAVQLFKDDTGQTTQTAEVYFRLQVQIGSKWLDFTSTAIPGSNAYTFSAEAAAGITPQDLFAAVGGQSYLEIMPALLQQYFSTIAFKGLSATILINKGFQVQSISATVGANVSAQNPWQIFGFSITQLDLNWYLMNPGTKDSVQQAYLNAQFSFMQDIFPQPFGLMISSDLEISGTYPGDVQLGTVINKLIGQSALPSSLNVTFSDLSLELDLRNNTYQFSGATEIQIDLFGNNTFRIDNCSFYIGAVVPKDGSTQFSAGISGTVWINDFGLMLAAAYEKGTETPGWRFKGGMADGQTLSLSNILDRFGNFPTPPSDFLPLDLVVSNVRAEIFMPGTGGGTYGVGGKVAWIFNMSGAGQQVNISADLWVSYDSSKPAGQQFSGYIQGELNISAVNADVILRYDFDGNDKMLTLIWAGFTAKYDITKSIIEFNVPSWNLGEMITQFMKMVSAEHFELDSPWDLLNKVDLPALKVVYNFGVNPSTVSATVTFPSTINLIFVQISGITLTKDASGTFLTFEGSYQGKPIGSGSPLDGKQDVQNLPTPAGQGNNILDLRMVALGQHITINGFQNFDSVDAVIKAMSDITNPASGTIPVLANPQPGQPMFNEQANWLIAMNFGLLKYQDNPAKYSVELELVFNDPTLYGLRLALDGDKVKFLAGLAFEIMYKKITDSIGMYKAELTLPRVIRTIDCGAFSITLPSFGIEVYTNGDFKVDIGFPYNLDFSKSFTFQAIIYGVPVLGAGGLYFGKLSSATFKGVPQTTLGEFNPVLIFGIGLQVGVGRTIDYGVLKAGFSITVVGIIEGIIASWHPYSGSTSAPSRYASDNQVAGNYYFKISGSIGLLGILYGTVDFSIIKASVNIKVYVTISATYESYRKMPLAIEAGVEVDLDVKIDLGLFSIKISFSFHMKIREELTIGSDEVAPWDGGSKLLSGSTAFLAKGLGDGNGCTPIPLVFKNTGTASQPLNLWFAPHLTVSGDPDAPYSAQQAQYVAMLYIPSPNAKDGVSGTPTDFEVLANAVFRWVLNAMPGFNGSSVTALQLCQLYATLSQTARPIGQQDILAFLQNSFTYVNITGLNADVDNASFFPIFPSFTMTAPAMNGGGGTNISFADFAQVDEAYIDSLIAYFNRLMVQVQQEGGDAAMKKALQDPTLISLAQFVFEDYFTMIARQMVQSAQECLVSYSYPLQQTDSLAAIATALNKAGNLVTAAGIANMNPGAQLAASASLTLSGLMASPVSTDSPASVAQTFAIDPATLIAQNQDNPSILAPGATIRFQTKSYVLVNGDTFTSAATALGTTITALSADSAAQGSEGIFVPGSPVLAAGLRTAISSGDSAQTLAGRYGADPAALLLFNALVPQLIAPGLQLTFNGQNYTTNAGDTLATIAAGLHTTLSLLAADTAFQINQQLFLPLAAVLIQPFTAPVRTGDTIQLFAARYGVTVSSLFDWYANAGKTHLFDASVTTLQVKQLEALSVDQLMTAIRSSNTVASLGGMISRFHLHGLRLPTEGIVFADAAHAPCAGQDTCGLYALTGQQFSLPVFKDGDTYSLSLGKANADWIRFDGIAQDTLTLPVPADAVASIRSVLSYAQTTGLSPEILTLGPGAVYREDARTFNFSAPVSWQAASAVSLLSPQNAQGGQISPQLRLWAFPDNLMQLIRGPQADASFGIRIGSQNGPGGDNTPESQQYRWATLVSFTLRKLAAGDTQGPAAAFSYELIGATQAGITLLERLLSVIRPEQLGVIDNLRLLYPPNPTGQLDGLLSDADASVTAFLTQSNLSTFTNPDMSAMSKSLAATEDATVSMIRNNFYDFIKMLWEASITRSGGFYLYYNQQAEGRGLPETIFDENGQATLELLITYTAPDVVADYMNYAVTGDTIDPSTAVVYASAEPQLLTAAYAAADSLTTLTTKFHATVLDIAEANPTAPLNPGLVLQLTGLAITAGAPAATPAPTLAGLQSYFNVTQAALTALNPQITQWNPVPAFSLINIPDTTYTVAQNTSQGTTLQSIAGYYRTTAGRIAWTNRDKTGFFTQGAQLTIDNQPVIRTALTPQGNVGLEMTRTKPDAGKLGYAGNLLESLYSMLGYSLTATPGFKAMDGGLPAGPSKDMSPADLQAGKKLLRADESGIWDFRLSAPVSVYANYNPIPDTPGLPAPAENPYAGVGQLAQIYLMWSDYFGNYAPSPLTLPGASGVLNNPILPVGYTDILTGFSAWPSVNIQYTYGGPPAVLTVSFHFDPKRYQQDGNASQGPTGDPIWLQHAREDLQAYTQIYYQLNQTYSSGGKTLNTVAIALNSSLCPSVDGTLSDTEFSRITGYVNAIYTFLLNTINGTAATVPADIQLTRNVQTQDVNAASIFELQVSLSITRNEYFVHPEFRDQQQVVQSVTPVMPPVAGLGDDAGGTIGAFAEAFEQALAVPGSYQLKLATGTDKEGTNNSGTKDLWVVRIGLTAAESIYFDVPQTPSFFAVPPLSNKLESYAVSIYPYIQGQGIDYNATPVTRSFTGIDMDAWAQNFLQAVDQFLSPDYANPAFITDLLAQHSEDDGLLSMIRDAKETLAGAVVKTMQAIFRDASPTAEALAEAREALRQQLLILLSNAYTVTAAVQYPVTASTNIITTGDGPNLYGSPDVQLGGQNAGKGADDDTDNGQTCSLTNAKIHLPVKNQAGGQYLTFLLSAKDVQYNADLNLSITYTVSHVEFEIEKVSGIDNYKSSSWLAFLRPTAVIGNAGAPLVKELGNADVPLVLRVYPTPPSLVAQTATGAAGGTTAAEQIAAATTWDFGFSFSHDNAAQDRFYGRMDFNLRPPQQLFAKSMQKSLFEALAEFTTWYPAVLQDLQSYLTKVDLQSDPESDQFKNALGALTAFQQLVTDVASCWDNGVIVPPPSTRMAAKSLANVQAVQYAYPFSIVQENINDLLQVTFHGLPAVDGLPVPDLEQPVVNIPGYKPVPPGTENGSAAPDNVWNYEPENGGPLLGYEEGLQIRGREVDTPGLGIQQYQNARASIYLTRNEVLAGKAVQEPFVYTTPPVSFSSNLVPLLSDDTPINAGQLMTGEGPWPLWRILQTFFSTLFPTGDAALSQQNIMVECRYSYPFPGSDGLPDIALPVLLSLPFSFAVPGDYQPAGAACAADPSDNDAYICRLAAGITSWWQTRRPLGTDGRLILNVSVFSELDDVKLPIAQLKQIELMVSEIDGL